MILKEKDYLSIKSDIDLTDIAEKKNMRFYYLKICAISTSTYSHQKQMKKEAIKIKKIIEKNYSEYLI